MDNNELAESICEKLGIERDQLNALYVSGPVGGYTGESVVAELAERFGLDPVEDLAAQLSERGILTDEEAAWFADA